MAFLEAHSGSGDGGSYLNFTVDGSGYWHGSPPDGMVIQNGDGGGHRYVAAGGRLFYYSGASLDYEFRQQMQSRHGTDQPAWMHDSDIHAIEANHPTPGAHRPANNILMRESGSTTQYFVQYDYPFAVASPEELTFLTGSSPPPATVVPPGSIAPLMANTNAMPNIASGRILKAYGNPDYYEIQNGQLYWLNNNSVIDCIVRYKGGAVQKVTASLLDKFMQVGRDTGQIGHCTYPANVAFYGPGGAERWHIAGSNPYTRARYTSPLALRCWLGSSPPQVEISQAAVNQPSEVASRSCPNNTYVRNTSTQQVFQMWDGVLHYVTNANTLNCLTAGRPEVVINVEEVAFSNAPQGSYAACTYEGKLIQTPGGQVYWVKDSQRRYVGSQVILNCIKVRANAGNPIAVGQGTVDAYTQGAGGYCPYPSSVRFVRGHGQTQVWRVLPDGTRQHATSLCVPNAESPTTDSRYRVHVMPAGEVDGHQLLNTTFYATPETCAAIP